MAKTQLDTSNSRSSDETPKPELLKVKTDTSPPLSSGDHQMTDSSLTQPIKRARLGSYRPSHKATFIGLSVVAIILAINAGIVVFVLKSHSNTQNSGTNQVTLNSNSLNKLGINNTPVGDSGIVLNINPITKFGNNVQVAGNVNVAGPLTLNNTLTATTANVTSLQAGNTALSQLNVNGNSTLSNLNLRNNLVVAGTTQLNGTVTLNQLLTVNNGLNVAGNLAVGGTLLTGSLQTSDLVVGGHITTAGYAPRASAGSCDGSNGTVSISGNDQTGTVAVNIGVGACAGNLVNVTFHSSYSATPHIVFTPIGVGGLFYVNRSTSGFSIGDSSSPTPGGYAFDYMVEQ